MNVTDSTTKDLLKLIGTVTGFTYNHAVMNEAFYSATIEVSRLSGMKDYIPIIVSERILTDEMKAATKENPVRVCVIGQVRTRNTQNAVGPKLFVFGFINEIELVDDSVADENIVILEGYLCKTPILRETPMGRSITDITLAVNRLHNSAYIPCILWGRNSRFIAKYTAQDRKRFHISGRFQSREYNKKISDSKTELRTVYEISVINAYDTQEGNEMHE